MKKVDRNTAIEEILTRMAKGESLRSILPVSNRPDHLPSKGCFLEWVSADKELADQYARAREEMADYKVEEMEDIAKGAKDILGVQKAKLIIDARKWALSKQFPKKYGDSIKISGDSENPIEIKRTTIVWDGKEIQV